MKENITPQELREAAYAAANLGKQFKALLLIADVVRDVENLDKRYQTLAGKRKASSKALEDETRTMEEKRAQVAEQLQGLEAEYGEKRAALQKSFDAQTAKRQTEITEILARGAAETLKVQKGLDEATAQTNELTRKIKNQRENYQSDAEIGRAEIAELKAEFAALKQRLG